MTTLNISKSICNILRLQKEVTDITQNRIFRIVAESGIKKCYVCVSRIGLVPSRYNNKDFNEDTQTIQFQCVSTNYDEAMECGEKIIKVLEDKTFEMDGFTIYKGTLLQATEDWIENSYVQTITMSFEVEK